MLPCKTKTKCEKSLSVHTSATVLVGFQKIPIPIFTSIAPVSFSIFLANTTTSYRTKLPTSTLSSRICDCFTFTTTKRSRWITITSWNVNVLIVLKLRFISKNTRLVFGFIVLIRDKTMQHTTKCMQEEAEHGVMIRIKNYNWE